MGNMGLCAGSQSKPAESNRIDKELRKARKEMRDHVKLLLLGTGGSGKSTIAKQMKIIFMDGFTKDELEEFKKILHNNTITSIKLLVSKAKEWKYKLSKQNQSHVDFVVDSNAYRDAVTPEMIPHIKAVWKDDAIQSVFKRAHQFPLPTSCKYCMENIENIAQPDYIPNIMDVLNARQRTTGILETTFFVDDFIFTMVDVGGQKNERRKWIHCFEGVNAIIYCVGLSDYDTMMAEDSATNMMHDSLALFESTTSQTCFNDTDIILFLNKTDLMREKATKVDLRVCFPDYSGGLDYEKAVDCIKKKFQERAKRAGHVGKKKLWIHETCAIDKENIEVVFRIVKRAIIREILDQAFVGESNL